MSLPPSPVLKVCGATTSADVESLARGGADFVGLWHGVPGGRADLTERDLGRLARTARATRRTEPVLVTFDDDPRRLAGVARRTGIRYLQLHAYQPPSVVRALREALPEAVLVKVLHCRRGDCLERPLTGAYERAGTDLFLLDRATADGRVGSTGERLPASDALALADRLGRPFWLAGGLSPASRPDYDTVVRHPGFRGIDVDTGARDAHGRLSRSAVRALARVWRTAGHPAPQEEHR